MINDNVTQAWVWSFSKTSWQHRKDGSKMWAQSRHASSPPSGDLRQAEWRSCIFVRCKQNPLSLNVSNTMFRQGEFFRHSEFSLQVNTWRVGWDLWSIDSKSHKGGLWSKVDPLVTFFYCLTKSFGLIEKLLLISKHASYTLIRCQNQLNGWFNVGAESDFNVEIIPEYKFSKHRQPVYWKATKNSK